MKKILSTENIIRLIVVIALIAFASSKYDLENILLGLLIIFGMALLTGSTIRLYQEFKSYLKTKVWNMNRIKSLIFVFLIILVSALFLTVLSLNLKIYSFLIVGVILLALLILDLMKIIMKKNVNASR